MNLIARMLLVGVCVGIVAVGSAVAAPIDSVEIKTRIWNDDSSSTLSTINSYPALIEISDTPTGAGYANLHVFRLAVAGAEHLFANNEAISFSADLTISGEGEGEAGLQLSPWWSPDIDGRFNFRTTDGEIAVFGGRLPFYSFTGSQGLTYTKGDTVRVGLEYNPNSLSSSDPATIVYNLTLGGTDYTSGPLAFDQGNPAEDPPYGLWGHLNDARVGGYVQVFTGTSGAGNNLTVQWEELSYAVPEPNSMALAGLGILGLMAWRRKR